MFYVYFDGTYYLTIKNLKMRRIKDITKAAYWKNEKDAKTWKNKVYSKYPQMVLKEAVLSLKRDSILIINT